MTPNFLQGGQKLPFEVIAEFMEGWTHFLEECNLRGLDLRKMPKGDNLT
jgi:hypothetical protein